jgi:phosphatidylinositol alpha 1,6-mannosyltransferase
MRVAIVTESFLPGLNGVTNSVVRVMDTLVERGDDVIVVAPTKDGPTYRGVEIVTCPFVSLAGFPVGIPTPVMTQALDRFRPDIIHVAAPFWLGGGALAYAEKRGIPSVAVYQTDVSGYMERYGLDFARPLLDAITGQIHKLATLNLAPTPDGQEYLRGLGIDNAQVWARGVDSELFHPRKKRSREAQALRKRCAPEGEFVVGYVGRLAPEKQVGRLREICGIPHTRLLIAGDGPEREELEDIFDGYPVTFLGRLEGEDLAHAYAAMDVFVHPGTEETFGQTLQEAHAAGVPVVAPNRGGPRHIVVPGETGYLVDWTQWGTFRGAVEALRVDRSLLERMSQASRASVAHKTWAANNTQLLGFYAQAMATVGASPEVLVA